MNVGGVVLTGHLEQFLGYCAAEGTVQAVEIQHGILGLHIVDMEFFILKRPEFQILGRLSERVAVEHQHSQRRLVYEIGRRVKISPDDTAVSLTDIGKSHRLPHLGHTGDIFVGQISGSLLERITWTRLKILIQGIEQLVKELRVILGVLKESVYFLGNQRCIRSIGQG